MDKKKSDVKGKDPDILKQEEKKMNELIDEFVEIQADTVEAEFKALEQEFILLEDTIEEEFEIIEINE